MRTGKDEASNWRMGRTPERPSSEFRQKTSLPVPFGLTAPIPVMTARRRLEGEEKEGMSVQYRGMEESMGKARLS